MISDNVLLKVLGNRINYFKYRDVIQYKALLERSVQVVKDLEAWYDDNTEAKNVDWESFSEWYRHLRHPSMSEEESQICAILFDRIANTRNDKLVDEILKSLVERAYAAKLMQLSQKVVNGRASVIDAQEVIDEFSDKCGLVDAVEDDPYFVQEGVIELLEDIYGDKVTGLHWPLEELNVSLGPIRTGDSVMIAAFTDSGKTSFILYCLQHMAKLLEPGKDIVYFANEERGKKIKLRFIQSMLGWNKHQMKASFKDTLKEFKKVSDIDRFKLFWHTDGMTTQYVEDTLKRCNPGLIVLDQLWNIQGFGKVAANSAERYGMLAQWARRVANKAPLLFTHQADATAHNCKFIEMLQLHGSKIAIQAATDGIITLGREVGDVNTQFERGLYTPKNKMDGDNGTIPKHVNAKWTLTFDPQTCSFKGSL